MLIQLRRFCWIKFGKILLAISFIAVLLVFLRSVLYSGYFYQYDNDELFHIQNAYLLREGFIPYLQVHMTYVPFFQLLLIPIFSVTGYTIQALYVARILMILLFLVRIIVLTLFISLVFGKHISILFLPVFLLSPIAVFSEMQVRPDNASLTVFVCGLYVFMRAYLSQNYQRFYIAAFLFGVSLLILFKIAPSVFVLSCFFFAQCIQKRKYVQIFFYGLILIAPLLIFFYIMMLQNNFIPMLFQVFSDANRVNDGLLYPQNILNYYWPNNPILFGYPGKPFPWLYNLLLPMLACIGIHSILFQTQRTKRIHSFWAILALMFVFQWVTLLGVRSVFIQYYIPVNWLIAVFASYIIWTTYSSLHIQQYGRILISAIASGVYLGIVSISIQANINRTFVNIQSQGEQFASYWEKIPKNAFVFPGYLFRPSIYPFGYGAIGDMPKEILARFQPAWWYLETYKIPYLVLDDMLMNNLDFQTQQYIEKNYHPATSPLILRIRKNI